MVKVSTRGRYGLRMMLELALQADQGPVRLSTIARNQEIPERYLAQLAQELRKAGLVRSVRGYGGGFLLTSPPSKIKLVEILVTLEGPISPVECVANPKICDRQSYCATTEVWREIGEAVTGILKSRTLQDLVIEHNKKRRGHPIRKPVRAAQSLKMPNCPANGAGPFHGKI